MFPNSLLSAPFTRLGGVRETLLPFMKGEKEAKNLPTSQQLSTPPSRLCFIDLEGEFLEWWLGELSCLLQSHEGGVWP